MDSAANSEVTRRFQRLFNHNPNRASQFLEIFEKCSESQETLSQFIQDFSGNSARLEQYLAISKKDWIYDNLTALQLLKQRLRNSRPSPTQRQPSNSSFGNDLYAEDPLKVEEAPWKSTYEMMNLYIEQFDVDPFTERFCFSQHEQYSSLEGDVATYTLINIINPVVSIMNSLLDYFHEEDIFLTIRGQFATKRREEERERLGERRKEGYVDHCVTLHKRRSPLDRGIPIVLIEEKVLGCTDAWYKWADKTLGYHTVDSGRYPILSKLAPQVRKYVFDLKTPYILETDSKNHVGMLWAPCPTWTNGKTILRERLIDNPYGGGDDHRPGYPHKCRYIPGQNAPGNSRLTGREVLALLCFMALRDYNYLKNIA